MRRSFGRWKLRDLLLSWLAYWAALVVVRLMPAAGAIWRVSRPGVKGDVSLGFSDGLLHLSVTAAGAIAWALR
jgi:hypothetical protein